MQFNLPTTKEQMYSILNDLYYYYRIRREGYEDLNLKELELERLDYTPETDAEIEVRARILLGAEQQREIDKYVSDLRAQIDEIGVKIGVAEQNAKSEIAQVEVLFSDSVNKIQKQAIKAGLIGSSVVVDKTATLESEKNLKIADITARKNQTVSELSAKKAGLENKLNQSASYFELAHQKDVQKKIDELIQKREQTTREVAKYNFGQDEKEQRYCNTMKQINSSLRIRFLAITAGEFTKDQLVDMGYYTDVIRCVTGYYDTLEPVSAYQDMSAEKKLAIYLDDYYPDIIYAYRLNAFG